VFFVLSFSGFSQTETKVHPGILTEVIIGIPNLKADQFNSVKSALKIMNGVIWSGYCEDQYCVFLLVDRAIQTDNKNITDVILDVNKNFKLYFKTASFDLMLNNCRDKEKALAR
jgi:hypothetical protein